MKEQLPGLMKLLIAQHVHKVFKEIAWGRGVHEQKEGQEGLCQRIPPAPVGSAPDWAGQLPRGSDGHIGVGGKSHTEQDHTQQKKEIGVVWVPLAITPYDMLPGRGTNSTNPMWALLGRPKAWLPPRTVEGSPVPSTSWLRVPWDRKEPLSFAKNRAIV